MANNIMPQAVNNFNIYLGDRGERMLGVAKVELPELQALTTEVNMAGMAGKVAVPIIGNYEAIKCTIDFGVNTAQVSETAAPGSQLITARAATQVNDIAAGVQKVQPSTYVMRGNQTTFKIGDLEKAAAQGTSIAFELDYIKVIIDNVPIIEIDKWNSICIINGVDYLADVNYAI